MWICLKWASQRVRPLPYKHIQYIVILNGTYNGSTPTANHLLKIPVSWLSLTSVLSGQIWKDTGLIL